MHRKGLADYQVREIDRRQANHLYAFHPSMVSTVTIIYGDTFIPAAIPIAFQWTGEVITEATPDGRFASKILADGGALTMSDRETNGSTAIIRGASKIDQVRFQFVLTNMKFIHQHYRR